MELALIIVLNIFTTLFQSSDYEKGMDFFNKGWEARQENNLDEALTNYYKAHYHLIRSGNDDKLLSVKKNIGAIMFDVGNYQLAIDFYDQAMLLSFDNNTLTRLKYNKARALTQLQDYSKSVELLIEVYRSTDSGSRIHALALNELGQLMVQIGEVRQAELYYQDLIAIANKKNLDNSGKYLGYAYHNLGDLKFKNEKYAEAEVFFDKSLSYKSPNDINYLLTLVDKGETQMKQGKFQASIITLVQAQNHPSYNVFNDRVLAIEQNLYKAYDSVGNHEMAVATMLAYEDRLNNHNQHKSELIRENQIFRSQMIHDQFQLSLNDKPDYGFLMIQVLAVLLVLVGVYFYAKHLRTEKMHREALNEIKRKLNAI